MSEEPCVCQTGFTCLALHEQTLVRGTDEGLVDGESGKPAVESDSG